MLRLRQPQESLWDQLLPPQARASSEERTTVDIWLADERFFEPYRQRFRTRVGRPTVPVETYLRLKYLKHRYKLGYEMLVREVADSLHWRRFCHLPLDGEVPHPTTLSKLTRKYGPDVIAELNRLLVRKARERKALRGRKLRIDTTVIQAPIEYPTDIGLLADGVRVVTRLVNQVQGAGAAVRTRFRNRMRTVHHALRRVGQALRARTGKPKRSWRSRQHASCTARASSPAGAAGPGQQPAHGAPAPRLSRQSPPADAGAVAPHAAPDGAGDGADGATVAGDHDHSGSVGPPVRSPSSPDPPGQAQRQDGVWLQGAAHGDRGAADHPP